MRWPWYAAERVGPSVVRIDFEPTPTMHSHRASSGSLDHNLLPRGADGRGRSDGERRQHGMVEYHAATVLCVCGE